MLKMSTDSPKPNCCCWKLKTWTTIIGVSQLVLSALATAEWVLGLVELSTDGTLLKLRNKVLVGVSVVLPVMCAIGFNVGLMLVISNLKESVTYLSTWIIVTSISVIVGALNETIKSFTRVYYWPTIGLLLVAIASASVIVVYLRVQEIKYIQSNIGLNSSQLNRRLT